MVQSEISRMDDIFELIDSLSLEDKAQIIGRLVSKNSGLSVILGSQFDHLQNEINLMPNRELGAVLNAIATKIRNC